jgi:hypothetical protein
MIRIDHANEPIRERFLSQTEHHHAQHTFDLDPNSSVTENMALVISPSPIGSLQVLDPRTRYLFTHCSSAHLISLKKETDAYPYIVVEHVSPIMTLFDDERNGYRHHVLPFAVYDNVVQRAVSVAAAFHLSDRMPKLRFPAEAGRAAIIQRLRETAVNDNNSQVFSETNWLTIILLIISDLVTGSEDVFILYKMLVPFLDGSKGRGDQTPMTKFLEYQSRL